MDKYRKSKIAEALEVAVKIIIGYSTYFIVNEMYIHEMNYVLTGSLIFLSCCRYIEQKGRRNNLVKTGKKEINIFLIGIRQNISIFVLCVATVIVVEFLRIRAEPIYAYIDIVLVVFLFVLQLKCSLYELAEKTNEN